MQGESVFTFQYGQIYYDFNYKEQQEEQEDLHSNMVRFIITDRLTTKKKNMQFTFQYGQIYY